MQSYFYFLQQTELETSASQFTANIAKLEEEKLSLAAKVQHMSVTQAKADEEKNARYLAMEKELAELKVTLSDVVEKTHTQSIEIESLNSKLIEAQVRSLMCFPSAAGDYPVLLSAQAFMLQIL